MGTSGSVTRADRRRNVSQRHSLFPGSPNCFRLRGPTGRNSFPRGRAWTIWSALIQPSLATRDVGGVCRRIIMIAWRSSRTRMPPRTKAMCSLRRASGSAITCCSEPEDTERMLCFAGRLRKSSARLHQGKPNVCFPPIANIGALTTARRQPLAYNARGTG